MPLAVSFRSTWLTSSLRALRERGRFEAYVAQLPPRFHESVFSTVVGVWLPIEVAVAHYAACDALSLYPSEAIAIGRQTTEQVHGTLLGTFVRLAKGAGVTPWTVLGRLNDLWGRIWVGGGLCVTKIGPKEAGVEIAGWPCAASPYCRLALRGVIPAMTDLFCTKSYAKEEPGGARETSVSFVVSWA